MKNNISVKTLVVSALLISLNIVITRLLSIDLGVVRIGFGFVPIAFSSLFYGSLWGAFISCLSDVLGAFLDGAGIWPGFTLSACLYGLSYGFLYGRNKTTKNILIVVLLQAVFIDSYMGALWYNFYAGTPFFAALLSRALNAAAMVPIKLFSIKYLWKYVGERLIKQNLI